ncbi:MAG: histidinol-phosphate transaminase [Saprospiraceae bacterium]|nr:histidinol-phosphate transaminase [Saprospiraceae bacterium]
MIRLSQNENPLGPSPKAMEAVLKQVSALNHYPEPHAYSLKKKLAERLNLEPENVLVSAGEVESLDIMIRNFVGEGNNMIVGEISFIGYRLLAKVFKVEARFSKLKDYKMDVDEILRCCDEHTKLIIIDNPNNPTGAIVSEQELIRLLEQISSGTLVVVDEAYMEYVTQVNFPDSPRLLQRYPNLVVMRTFSKIYGLAALRVGYTIANPAVVEKMEHYQAPFTVNGLGLVAAMHAMDDVEFVAQSKAANEKERRRLYNELKMLGNNVVPSQSNYQFVYFDTVDQRDHFYTELFGSGIMAQKTDSFGAENALRVSIGRAEDNSAVIDCFSLNSVSTKLI